MVNDLGDVKINALLFEYDTNYGRSPDAVEAREDGFIINGQEEIKILSFLDPAQITRRRLRRKTGVSHYHGASFFKNYVCDDQVDILFPLIPSTKLTL